MKASSLGKDCILMWPCNDGTSRNVGGDPSGAANQAVFNPAFTSSSRNGNAFITRAVWAWDPRVGGFCFNNDASVGNAARDGLTTLNPNSEVNTIDVGTSFAVGVWAFFKSFTTDLGFGPIMFCHTDGVNNNFYLQIVTGANNARLGFTTTSGAVFKLVTGSKVIQLNRWYFFMGTYDGAASNIYVDGALDASAANSGTPDSPGTDGVYTIGNFQPTGGFQVRGCLWQATVFKRCLTADEVRYLWEYPFMLVKRAGARELYSVR